MPGYCDQAKKGDIDWAGMAAEAGAKAGARWDVVCSWTKAGHGGLWRSCARRVFPGEARVQDQEQQAIQVLRKTQQASPERFLEIDDAWAGTREDCVLRRPKLPRVLPMPSYSGASGCIKTG